MWSTIFYEFANWLSNFHKIFHNFTTIFFWPKRRPPIKANYLNCCPQSKQQQTGGGAGGYRIEWGAELAELKEPHLLGSDGATQCTLCVTKYKKKKNKMDSSAVCVAAESADSDDDGDGDRDGDSNSDGEINIGPFWVCNNFFFYIYMRLASRQPPVYACVCVRTSVFCVLSATCICNSWLLTHTHTRHTHWHINTCVCRRAPLELLFKND